MKRIRVVLFCAFCILTFMIFGSSETKAVDYNYVCKESIVSEYGNYRRCGTEHIFLSDDRAHSSTVRM